MRVHEAACIRRVTLFILRDACEGARQGIKAQHSFEAERVDATVTAPQNNFRDWKVGCPDQGSEIAFDEACR